MDAASKDLTSAEPETAGPAPAGTPTGNHPLEIAAREGFGPLSAQAQEVWHGRATPCVTCGQLVRRDAQYCEHCEQDLSPAMIERMRAYAGPWYILEHLRPFPGISLDRVIRQIRRGLITETSIVRGPSTDFQWRFAVEAPGLCRYFGRCWKCHAAVNPADSYCQLCLAYLSFEKPKPGTTPEAPAPSAAADAARSAPRAVGVVGHAAAIGSLDDLAMLRAALNQASLPTSEVGAERGARIAGLPVGLVVGGVVLVVLLALVWFATWRAGMVSSAPSRVTPEVQLIYPPVRPPDVPAEVPPLSP